MKTAGDVSIRRLSVGEISPVSKRGVAAKSLNKGKQQQTLWDPQRHILAFPLYNNLIHFQKQTR